MKAAINLFLFLSIIFGLRLQPKLSLPFVANYDADIKFEMPWITVDKIASWIFVGVDGKIWCVDDNNGIWTRPGVGGNWSKLRGSLKQIAVGVDGRRWGVDSSGKLKTTIGS